MQLPKRHMLGRAGVCSYYEGCQKGKYVLYGIALHSYAVAKHMLGRAGVCSYYEGCQKGIYVLYGIALHSYAVAREAYAGTSRCV